MTPNLVDLIRQDGVQMRRIGGSRYAGKCPFHGEKTPSFHVWDTGPKWRYFCHSCKVTGDSIDWLRIMRKMTWKEATAFLGGPIPASSHKRTAPRVPELTDVQLLDLHTSNWRSIGEVIRQMYRDPAWLARYACPMYGWASGAFVKSDAATLAARPPIYRRENIPLSDRDKALCAYRDSHPHCSVPDWGIET